MRISASASEKPGVRRAVAVMGTPMNREQLASSGLLAGEAQRAGPNDLVLAVEADGAEAARDELAAMEAALTAPRTSVGAGPFMNLSVPTLDAALGKDPRINLALFSIPGASVRREAERALARGPPLPHLQRQRTRRRRGGAQAHGAGKRFARHGS